VPRLLREARAAASLTHPHIGVVYEVDTERGFIAMEWVEGRTLAERIGGRPLPAEEALALALQIGEGLKAAHHRGIVHRDVKSANVLVTPQGQAKILDFGLARMAGQAGPRLIELHGRGADPDMVWDVVGDPRWRELRMPARFLTAVAEQLARAGDAREAIEIYRRQAAEAAPGDVAGLRALVSEGEPTDSPS
jgi:serine/threonine protein kinase